MEKAIRVMSKEHHDGRTCGFCTGPVPRTWTPRQTAAADFEREAELLATALGCLVRETKKGYALSDHDYEVLAQRASLVQRRLAELLTEQKVEKRGKKTES